uniref:Uncharacterized protein ycf20 n=1 Tax=Helminthora furcellata TaxID=1884666 RepID=A0A1G4NRA5_9FLOR|nr:Hypothetical protein ycf20 [Helminthora furcellata]SCW21106.1 Hypothetical protein ycf20 [Helminthora furcellata]SCW23966.1 Hypothetical protein ycf20 [Helminthora furcellata]
MDSTNLAAFVKSLSQNFSKARKTNINALSLSVLYMLLGFFISTTLSTIPGQTGDWGIIGAAIIVTFYERISQQTYPLRLGKNFKKIIIHRVNYIKIGILYGLFVDAFKLGS